MKTPTVTVLMPVYNGERFLAEAIESILSQTFVDFELLIVDDGSTDGTAEILERYSRSNSRVRTVRNERNSGIVASLNRGIGLSRGELIARMDADDVSLPHRLERQLAYLDAHREIAVCGSFLKVYDSGEQWAAPVEDAVIRANLLFNSCIFHPTVILRKEFLAGFTDVYAAEARHAEDFDLWVRLSAVPGLVFGNVPEALLRYRVYEQSQREQYKAIQRMTSDRIRKTALARLDIHPTAKEYECHALLFESRAARDGAELRRCGEWLRRISENNRRLAVHDAGAMRRVLSSYWLGACRRSARTTRLAPFVFFSSPLTCKNLKSLAASFGMLRTGMGAP